MSRKAGRYEWPLKGTFDEQRGSIKAVKKQISITDVLRHYGWKPNSDATEKMREIGYIDGGTGWKPIRCPFHDDKQPSASVKPSTGHFQCHASCNWNGDQIDLVMWREHIPNVRKAMAWMQSHITSSSSQS